MSIAEKKPGLAIMIGLGAKKKKDEEPAEAGDSSFEGSARNAFDALKDDDFEGFKLALENAIHSCTESD